VHWAGVVPEAIRVRQYPGAHSVILAVWLRSAKQEGMRIYGRIGRLIWVYAVKRRESLSEAITGEGLSIKMTKAPGRGLELSTGRLVIAFAVLATLGEPLCSLECLMQCRAGTVRNVMVFYVYFKVFLALCRYKCLASCSRFNPARTQEYTWRICDRPNFCLK